MILSSQRLRVLCFSRDPRLLRTRGLVLETCYAAVCVGSLEEMEALPQAQAFDLVLLCHSLSANECDRSASLARERWPAAKIVAIATPESTCSYHLDEVVAGLDGPAVLMSTLEHVLAS
ncbi:MAG TPA: hypothetical protein VGD62_03710 [Acidobacteriaceae bacterium]